jgi:hypothetical protein
LSRLKEIGVQLLDVRLELIRCRLPSIAGNALVSSNLQVGYSWHIAWTKLGHEYAGFRPSQCLPLRFLRSIEHHFGKSLVRVRNRIASLQGLRPMLLRSIPGMAVGVLEAGASGDPRRPSC